MCNPQPLCMWCVWNGYFPKRKCGSANLSEKGDTPEMKRELLLSLFAAMLCITSCGMPAKPPIETPVLSTTAQTEVFFADPSVLAAPAGIAYFGDRIIVSDFQNNALVVLDTDGNYLATVGEPGADVLQFNKPGAMTTSGDTLYVLDMGNRRIQCLNSDFEYIDSIYLWEETQYFEFPYTDIAISDDETIYVSSGSLNPSKAGVYTVDNTYTHEYKTYYGFLDNYAGSVYFINTGGFTKKGGTTTLDIFGENHLYSFADGSQTMLPSALYSSDFLMTADSLIVLAYDGSSIIRLDRSGDYVETIADFRQNADAQTEWSMNSYIAMDTEGNLYSTQRNGGIVYKVSQK